MKIPTPNYRCAYCTMEILLSNGEKFTAGAIGGVYVEVPDDAVEVICRSYDATGPEYTHAWTKEDGVQTLALYLQAKKLREKIAAYEERHREQTRKVKRAAVQDTVVITDPPTTGDVSPD